MVVRKRPYRKALASMSICAGIPATILGPHRKPTHCETPQHSSEHSISNE